MTETIETDRLLLRRPNGDDFPVYEAFFADADASRAYGGPLAADAAWRKLASDIGHWEIRGFGVWMMCERDGGRHVGGCGVVAPHGWRPELTWWVIPQARRRGYAMEASRAVIAYAYQTLGWSDVETYANDQNDAAHGLIARLGGVRMGREAFPDGLMRTVYGLPEEE